MSIIGDAYVVVHAVTDGFKKDIKGAVHGMNLEQEGEKAGKDFAKGLTNGSSSNNSSGSMFSSLLSDLDRMRPKALETYHDLQMMSVEGHTMGVAIAGSASSIGALVDGAISLGSSFAAAAPTILTFIGGMSELGLAAFTVKQAMTGVGQAITSGFQAAQNAANTSSMAIQQADKALKAAQLAQTNQQYNADIEGARATVTHARAIVEFNLATIAATQELNNLNFAIKGSSLDQQQAALNVTKATMTLRALQDLPPSNAARKQAELDLKTAKLAQEEAIQKTKDLQIQAAQDLTGDATGLQSFKDALQAKTDANIAYAQQKKNADYAALQSQKAVDAAALAAHNAQQGGGALETYKQQLSQLGPAAKSFVEYMVGTVMPDIQKFQAAIGAELFPGLKTGIDNLITNLLPPLTPLMTKLGGAAGDAFISISKALTTPYNIANLKDIFGTAAVVVKEFGKTAGTAMIGVTTALSAASPAIKALSTFLNARVTKFVSMLETKKASGELTAFFNQALKIAEQLSGIFGNMFSGLFNVIKANTGPGSGGQILLDFFTQISKEFKNFSSSKAGQESLRTMFAQAARNVTAMLPEIGKIFQILMQIGTNKSVAVFWNTIQKMNPFIQQIVTAFTNAGPTFANLIVSVVKFLSLLVSSGAINDMFTVFLVTMNAINAVFSNKLFQAIFNVSHQLFAIGAAFLVLGKVGGFAMDAVLGHFVSLGKVMNLVIHPLSNLAGSVFAPAIFKLQNFGDKLLALGKNIFPMIAKGAAAMWEAVTGPIGLIVIAVVALVAIFVELFKHNKAFHDLVIVVWNDIKKIIGIAVHDIIDFFNQFIAVGKTIWNFFLDGLKLAWDAVKIYFEIVIGLFKLEIKAFIAIGTIIWDFLKDALKIAWDAAKLIWNGIKIAVAGYIAGIVLIGKTLWSWIIDALKLAWDGAKLIWNVVVTIVKDYIKGVVAVGSTLWSWVKTGLQDAWDGAKLIFDTIVKVVSGIGKILANGAGDVWGWLKTGLKDVVNFIIGMLNVVITALDKVSFKIPSWVPGILGGGKTFGIDIPTIPLLAAGGVVAPKAGGTLALLGEAGRAERVEPLDPSGLSARDKAMMQMMSTGGSGNGTVIHVHPSPGQSEAEIAAMVSRRFAFEMRRGGV